MWKSVIEGIRFDWEWGDFFVVSPWLGMSTRELKTRGFFHSYFSGNGIFMPLYGEAYDDKDDHQEEVRVFVFEGEIVLMHQSNLTHSRFIRPPQNGG